MFGVFRIVDDEMVREVGGADEVSLFVRGDFGRIGPEPLELGFRKGDDVRLMTGGVCVLDGGLLGRLIDGLSQDEKKSSLGSPTGVAVPSVDDVAATSVTMTSSGYLRKISNKSQAAP